MAMRPHVRRDKRQAALLAAIHTAPHGRWKSGRASTASADLQALVTTGHLARHEETGVVWYEPLGVGLTGTALASHTTTEDRT